MLPFYNRPLKAAATAASLLLLLTACGGGGGGSDPAPAAAARGALALVAPDPASAEEQPYTTLVETEYEIGRITVTDPKRDASLFCYYTADTRPVSHRWAAYHF